MDQRTCNWARRFYCVGETVGLEGRRGWSSTRDADRSAWMMLSSWHAGCRALGKRWARALGIMGRKQGQNFRRQAKFLIMPQMGVTRSLIERCGTPAARLSIAALEQSIMRLGRGLGTSCAGGSNPSASKGEESLGLGKPQHNPGPSQRSH